MQIFLLLFFLLPIIFCNCNSKLERRNEDVEIHQKKLNSSIIDQIENKLKIGSLKKSSFKNEIRVWTNFVDSTDVPSTLGILRYDGVKYKIITFSFFSIDSNFINSKEDVMNGNFNYYADSCTFDNKSLEDSIKKDTEIEFSINFKDVDSTLTKMYLTYKPKYYFLNEKNNNLYFSFFLLEPLIFMQVNNTYKFIAKRIEVFDKFGEYNKEGLAKIIKLQKRIFYKMQE